MAGTLHTHQYGDTVTIPREELTDLAISDHFGKMEYKVIMLLFTYICGFNKYTPGGRLKKKDPNMYNKISIKEMAKSLGTSKDKIKDILYYLIDEGVIEIGNTPAGGKGYRFTF